MEKKVVINLFGGPGYGKSTCAAYLFSKMKSQQKFNVEMVTEYAKDLYYLTGITPPFNQAFVFGNQLFKIEQHLQHADIIIVDSPLILSAIYNKSPYLKMHFDEMIVDAFDYFNNINFLLETDFGYKQNGRYQTESESRMIHERIKAFLKERGIPYYPVTQEIYDDIIEKSVEYLLRLNE